MEMTKKALILQLKEGHVYQVNSTVIWLTCFYTTTLPTLVISFFNILNSFYCWLQYGIWFSVLENTVWLQTAWGRVLPVTKYHGALFLWEQVKVLEYNHCIQQHYNIARLKLNHPKCNHQHLSLITHYTHTDRYTHIHDAMPKGTDLSVTLTLQPKVTHYLCTKGSALWRNGHLLP